MVARGLAGGVGCALFLLAGLSRAQAPAVQFPPEQPGAAKPSPAAPSPSPSPAPVAPAAAPAAPAPVTPTPAPAAPAVTVAPVAPLPAPPVAVAPIASLPPRAPQVAPAPAPVYVPRSEAEPAAARHLANWSLGGGVGSNTLSLIGLSQGTTSLAYEAALERRLSANNWLALGAFYSFQAQTVPLQLSLEAMGGRTELVLRNGSFAVLLGLRHVFVHSVIDFSMFWAAFGGHHSVGGEQLRSGENIFGYPTPGSHGTSLGLVSGLAVERELIEGLGLRLSVDLVNANYTSATSVAFDDVGVRKDTTLNEGRVELALNPALLLYFYF